MSLSLKSTRRSRVKLLIKHLDISSRYALVFSARDGLSSKIFFDFASIIDMNERELASILDLSTRTLNVLKSNEKPLSPANSEHLLKIISLFAKGEEIFGSVGEFKLWLNKPFWNSVQSPLDWIYTPGGVDLVIDELNRLAEGYPL